MSDEIAVDDDGKDDGMPGSQNPHGSPFEPISIFCAILMFAQLR